MLRKRARSHPKDQNMNNSIPDSTLESYFKSDIKNQKHKDNSLLKVPGLFVGFNPRNSDSDSVRSPTSPLDFRIFSSLGNPFRCLRSHNEGHQKSWDCCKVGLSIIDSLDHEPNQTGNVSRLSDNNNNNNTNKNNILFGRQMSIRSPNFCSRATSLEAPKSLPKDVAIFPNTLGAKPGNARKSDDSDVVFEIGEVPFEVEAAGSFRARSVDSGRFGSRLKDFGNLKSRLGSGNLLLENTQSGRTSPKLGNSSGEKLSSVSPSMNSGNCFVSSIPASEIELSEDYTCVRTHGPNPKVTHIFGDCILECHNDVLTDFSKKNEGNVLPPYPSEDFLKFCYTCHKKLDGEDIYMYRGEKAFCSTSCRSQEIDLDEEDGSESSNNICAEAS